jgi:hypothetical protein
MTLTEQVKSFLTNMNTAEPEQKVSSQVQPDNIVQDLTNQDIYSTGAFFDDEKSGVYGSSDKADKLESQKQKIMTYRNIAKTPDVNDALEEIVNEVSFSLGDKGPITININEENVKIEETVTKAFDKIMKLLNIKRNLYNIVRNTYIDGQMIMHCAYGDKNTKEGIKSLKMIEPVYLYYDVKKEVFKYHQKDNHDFFRQEQVT